MGRYHFFPALQSVFTLMATVHAPLCRCSVVVGGGPFLIVSSPFWTQLVKLSQCGLDVIETPIAVPWKYANDGRFYQKRIF